MARRSLQYLPVLAILCGLNVGASCLSSGDEDDYSSRDTSTSDRLPRDAKSVKSGSGDIAYTVPSDGRIYIYDTDKESLKFDKMVNRGDVITVRPENDRIGVNDRLEKVELSGDHSHRIYFRSDSESRTSGRRPRDDGYSNGGYSNDSGSSRSGVPDHAKVMGEGRGRDISFKAPDSGKVYLYDATDDRLIETYNIDRGERFTISPKNDAVAIEGRSVSGSGNLSTRTNYRVLFAD